MSRIFLAFCVLWLAACSNLFGREGYFRDRGDDYLKAAEIPPMKVSKELDSAAISELFVIPPINNEFVDQDAEFEVPRSSFDTEREKSQVKIQKLDNRRWILVNSSPTVIWPRLKRFLEENQFSLASEDTVSGQVETVWLSLKNETDSKDRYRFQIEQGLHISTTEIHVLQITASMNTPDTGNVNWPSHSVNPEREKWMVDKLAAYLAQNDSAPVSLLAQSIGRAQKVSFVQPYQGEAFILMTLDKERVLASVGGALNQPPFAVEDINRSAGFINTSYDPAFQQKTASADEKEEEPGFFARLFFDADKRAEKQRNERLLHYRVQVEAITSEEMHIFIRDTEGKALPVAERDRLLQKIRQGLL